MPHPLQMINGNLSQIGICQTRLQGHEIGEKSYYKEYLQLFQYTDVSDTKSQYIQRHKIFHFSDLLEDRWTQDRLALIFLTLITYIGTILDMLKDKLMFHCQEWAKREEFKI